MQTTIEFVTGGQGRTDYKAPYFKSLIKTVSVHLVTLLVKDIYSEGQGLESPISHTPPVFTHTHTYSYSCVRDRSTV